jgi:hypothetical protein
MRAMMHLVMWWHRIACVVNCWTASAAFRRLETAMSKGRMGVVGPASLPLDLCVMMIHAYGISRVGESVT